MSFVNSCAGALNKDLVPDCAHPLVGGYTGRAVLIDLSQSGITLSISSGVVTVTLTSAVKTCAVNNCFAEQPLNGSATNSNADDGFRLFEKTVTALVPGRDTDMADSVDAMLHAPMGFLAILEKRQKDTAESYEVIGVEQGLRVNADGITRNEYEQSGAVQVTMSCKETKFQYRLAGADAAACRTTFEGFLDHSNESAQQDNEE